MDLGNQLFKLEKLKIVAYKKVSRELIDKIDTFEAMFNPESITQNYEILYGINQAIGSSSQPQKYAKSKPSDLSLSLVLDGNRTTAMGITQLTPPKTVSERVKQFLDVAFNMNGPTHEPNYLVLEWGDIKFKCRLSNCNIRYTSFDRDGKPLRANVDIKLISDQSIDDLQKEERKSSPDLSHSRVVRAGDTLPLLAKEIYGSSAHYLWVAQANDLDEIRCLTPGQRLIFPPLPTVTPVNL
ncbi:MAG: hypothetical protein ABTQ25_00795 [Nitrosomonas ureae]